ncbi:MAG: UDP-2,3-diacylglucosamine diphosphatase LpxI [Candidatus Omnitrophica bacterium]|nr:UDP-2,3-diacylglucosamine diphosphatase LpxI [Candidatus Omnitrophota bacterium]MBU2043964.1 UDP-2,3-diacylglucosamine diphosphatase LpxI [Candidatus Omnitrophota bacterium]MBU2473429.1 UDP-2,3-diacylglucosamine diphosphatase LpxI [Candidatus Omnitrophota bacterium]
MRVGIIAGNRKLPLLLAQRIKQKDKQSKVVAICFRGETDPSIENHVDQAHWLKVGALGQLKEVIQAEGLKDWIMAGQINPLHIFRRKSWDKQLESLIGSASDFRPHAVFKAIINDLESVGINFLDSTVYLSDDLAKEGLMNFADFSDLNQDIDFGLKVISRFVELDVGQTIVVKKGSVVGLESLEGTDRAINRAYRLAGKGCLVLKFSKSNQDLRFDVPVVGISTLKLLKSIKARGLVLEKDKVIILDKPLFLSLADKWKIPVIGRSKVA